MKCRQKDCPDPAADKNRGYCRYHYRQSLRKRVQAGTWISGRVPSAPVVEHVMRLRAAGLGQRRIAELAEVDSRVVQRLPRQKTVYAMTASRICAIPVPLAVHKVAFPRAQISVLGTQRRLRALVRIGYSQKVLAQMLGCTETHVWRFTSGYQRLVTADYAERVDKLFQRLQLTPGTDNRAACRAERNGWPAPLMWDEDIIDLPEAEPVSTKVDKDGWFEDYLELKSLGKTNEQIAERLGVTHEALNARLRRHNATANFNQEHE